MVEMPLDVALGSRRRHPAETGARRHAEDRGAAVAIDDDGDPPGAVRRSEQHGQAVAIGLLPFVLVERMAALGKPFDVHQPAGRQMLAVEKADVGLDPGPPVRAEGGKCLDMRFELAVAALPVEPGDRIVLRIGVVVAVLGAAEFVAGGEHDAAARGKQRRQHGAAIAPACFDDRRIGALALDAVVPRQVLVVAVAILLAIRLIVLALVAGQVGKRQAVMRGDEIDRARGLLGRPCGKYPTSRQAGSQAGRSCAGRRARSA